MKSPAFGRLGVLLLAAALGGAIAQTAPAPTPKVLSDAQPLPAEDRASLGAVVFQEAPVLAQQELVQRTASRNRELMTTMMGAGPAPLPAVTNDKADEKPQQQPSK